jgi:DNA anti-recombination protein RmuC
MSQNSQDIEQLGKRIEDMKTILVNAKDRGTLSETILGRIDRLSAYVFAVCYNERDCNTHFFS